MSYFNNAIASCPNAQAYLDDAWRLGDLGIGADEQMPHIEFLASPANKRGINMMITPGRGKIRVAEMVYEQRRLESTVTRNQPNPNCAATNKYGDNIATYTLDPDENLQVNEQIALTDFEVACADNAAIMGRKIAAMIDVLGRAVATEVAIQSVALTGKWGGTVTVNGSNQFVINTLNTGTQNPAPFAWQKLRNAANDTGFGNSIAIIGGTTMRDYFQYLQAGCCADYGIDLGAAMAQWGYGFAYDKRLQSALASGGANEFVVFQPGAQQLLNFSRAEGKAAMGQVWNASSDYFYATIRDPRTGQMYDLTGKDTCGTLNLTLTWTGKVIAMPSDMFAVGDNYNGVTYTAQGLVTNS